MSNDRMSDEEAAAFLLQIREDSRKIRALIAADAEAAENRALLMEWAAAAVNMTPEALVAMVPVHQSPTGAVYVVIEDVPHPWRDLFTASLKASSAPAIEGAGPCAWAHDWRNWVYGL